jgi:hypothetical protein
MGKGNGVRPVGSAREPGRGGQACLRVPARTFSLLQLLRFILFVARTRGIEGGRAGNVLVPFASAILYRLAW